MRQFSTCLKILGIGPKGRGCIHVGGCPPFPISGKTFQAAKRRWRDFGRTNGYPPDKPLDEAVAWHRVRQILKKRRAMFLHFDNAHNVLHNAHAAEIVKIQATFRNLMISIEWPVQLVLCGIDDTSRFSRTTTSSSAASSTSCSTTSSPPPTPNGSTRPHGLSLLRPVSKGADSKVPFLD